MTGRSRSWAAVALALALVPLAGCFGNEATPRRDAATLPEGVDPILLAEEKVADGLARAAALDDDPLLFDLDITWHLVFVGFPDGLVDEEAMRAALPPDYSPVLDWSPRPEDGVNSQLLYRYAYEFHHAPPAFAEAMFAHAAAVSREAPANRLLQEYDRDYGFDRLQDGETVDLVDAEKLESWMAGNRSAYGLEFAKPSYTIFFLDAYTNGYLPRDRYHYLEFRSATLASTSDQTMRAWGGTYDFLLLDVSAAPNWDTFDQSKIAEEPFFGLGAPAPEGTAYNDPPIWHYGPSGEAVVGDGATEKTLRIDEVLARDVHVAVNLRMVASYAYRPVYKPTYYVNLRFYHDGRSQFPKDLESQVDLPRILASLQAEVPWATVTGDVKTYVLPGDDPDMDAAITRAKAEGGGTYVPTQPIADYVNLHPERFTNQSADVFNVRALLFLFEGHYTLVLPLIVGGVALATPDGQAWGTMSSVNDVVFSQGGNAKDTLTFINAHEVGHFFGLWHAHDGFMRRADGSYGFQVDHTWSQTNTVMSYRLTPFTADDFDRDTLARAHTVETVTLAIRDVASAYRVLDAQGLAAVPRAVATPLRAAEESANTALALFHRGLYVDAVHAAIAALGHADAALDLAGTMSIAEEKVLEWDGGPLDHAGVKHAAVGDRASVTLPGVVKDYREVALPRDAEEVRVVVSWTNSPTSWGDLFVGWDTDWDLLPFLDLGLPVGPVVNPTPPFGVHDCEAETALSGASSIELVLDLSMFPILYDRGSIHGGAGAIGAAVQVSYHVDVYVTKRGFGDAADDAASAGDGGGAAAGPFAGLPVAQDEAARDDLVRVPVQHRVAQP